MKIKAIILDDELDALDNLHFLLKNYCQDVEVIASFVSAKAALSALPSLDFDILFLDIEMPVLSGFDFLDQLDNNDFQIVFITSYNQYAIKAFRYSALDYLLKPVDIEELKLVAEKAVSRCEQNLPLQPHLKQLSRFNSGKSPDKVALPVVNGYEFADIESIIFIQADGRYSKVYLVNADPSLVSINLKEFEEMLKPSGFLRIHNTYLINLNFMESYSRSDGGFLKMNGGLTLPVSRSKKPLLERILKSHVPGKNLR